MSLGLSIPLYNEADSLASTVHDLLLALTAVDATIVLVNNGSTDQTGHIVKQLTETQPAIHGLHLPKNAGYGGGILAGVHALLNRSTPPAVIGWMWGDNQVDPGILPTLYQHCIQGTALAKAQRTARQDGWQRQVISAVYAKSMRGIYQCQTPDINGCPKLFRADVLHQLNLSSTDWFLDAEAILKLEQRCLPIQNVPTTMRPRLGGRSKVNWKTVMEFIQNIARHRRQYAGGSNSGSSRMP